MATNKDANRLVYVEGISLNNAVELSKTYSNIIFLTDDENKSESTINDIADIDNTDDYEDNGYWNLGLNIVKNGKQYIPISGIHPKYDSFTIGNDKYYIKVQKNTGLLMLLQKTNDNLPKLKIDPTSVSINYGGTQTVTASLSKEYDGISIDSTSWALSSDNSSFTEYVTLNDNTGEEVTLTSVYNAPPVVASARISTAPSNKTTLSASDTVTLTSVPEMTRQSISGTLTATLAGTLNTSASSNVNLRGSVSISYLWSVTGTDSCDATLSTNAGYSTTLTVNNKSTSLQSIIVNLKIKSGDDVLKESNQNFSVNGIQEEKTYYWYVGQNNPYDMTTISPVVDDDTSPTAPGWRLIGTTLPEYNISNKLHSSSPDIEFGGSKAMVYVALPNSDLFIYDDMGTKCTKAWKLINTKTINKVIYYIYASIDTSGEEEQDIHLKSWGYNIY